MSILAFASAGGRQVKVLGWQQLLDAAETEAEVVRVHANMRLSRILARTNDEDGEVRDRA